MKTKGLKKDGPNRGEENNVPEFWLDWALRQQEQVPLEFAWHGLCEAEPEERVPSRKARLGHRRREEIHSPKAHSNNAFWSQAAPFP